MLTTRALAVADVTARGVAAVVALGALVVVPVVRAQVGAEHGRPVTVIASNGVRAPLDALLAGAERAIRRPIAAEFGTTASLRLRIDGGAPFDVALLTAEAIDELVIRRALVPGTRTALGRSGIGVGVRTGSPTVATRDADALKTALLHARAVTFARDGASRPHIEQMIRGLGLADTLGPRIIREQGSIRAAARVVDGDADIVMTLVSEILPVKGLTLAGPLPDRFQAYVAFAGAMSERASLPGEAKALLAYLASATATPTFTRTGIDRPGR